MSTRMLARTWSSKRSMSASVAREESASLCTVSGAYGSVTLSAIRSGPGGAVISGPADLSGSLVRGCDPHPPLGRTTCNLSLPPGGSIMSVLVTVKLHGDTAVFRSALDERKDEFVGVVDRARDAGAIHHRFAVGDGFVLVVDEWEIGGELRHLLRRPEPAGVHRVGGCGPVHAARGHGRRGDRVAGPVLSRRVRGPRRTTVLNHSTYAGVVTCRTARGTALRRPDGLTAECPRARHRCRVGSDVVRTARRARPSCSETTPETTTWSSRSRRSSVASTTSRPTPHASVTAASRPSSVRKSTTEISMAPQAIDTVCGTSVRT